MTTLFRDVVPDPGSLMGVKAVWGRSQAPVMCFGSRGNAELRDKAHFSQARRTSEMALSAPYLVTIGGGAQVPATLAGRALELVRVTGTFGETKAFVQDEGLLERLGQWPVAVVLSEIYSITGKPSLVGDLGFEDMMILANAYDGVRRDPEAFLKLYDALSERPVVRRWDVLPPPGFVDRKKLVLSSTYYPVIANLNGSEGQRRWKLSKESERDSRLRSAAIEANRTSNGGKITCQGCGIEGELAKLFDVHHRLPLCAGDRETRLDDLAVLCPNCHRCCHALAEHRLKPLPVEQIALHVSAAYATSR